MGEPQVTNGAEDHVQRILTTRKVLYDDNTTSKQYVDTYEQWSEHYNADGERLGFMSWEHGSNAIEKWVPNKEALILDYCGGTGQCGKRLNALGYKNLHVSDGSPQMLSQAMRLGVYKQAYLGVVEPHDGAEYLKGVEDKFDAILSSMSMSEYQPLVEQMVTKALKVGGIFISLEAEPHIIKIGLTGLTWLIETDGKDDRFEILVNDNDLPHDKFTDDKMKLLVVKRLK